MTSCLFFQRTCLFIVVAGNVKTDHSFVSRQSASVVLFVQSPWPTAGGGCGVCDGRVVIDTIPVEFVVLRERRFSLVTYSFAQALLCGNAMLRLTCQGQGATNFEFMSVRSHIARSCFGLSVCPEVPVESCFFDMSGYTYKTEVHALHGMNKHGGFGRQESW